MPDFMRLGKGNAKRIAETPKFVAREKADVALLEPAEDRLVHLRERLVDGERAVLGRRRDLA